MPKLPGGIDAARLMYIKRKGILWNDMTDSWHNLRKELILPEVNETYDPKGLRWRTRYIIAEKENCECCYSGFERSFSAMAHVCSAEHVAELHGVAADEVRMADAAFKLLREIK